jgi:protein-disulfide isomerase
MALQPPPPAPRRPLLIGVVIGVLLCGIAALGWQAWTSRTATSTSGTETAALARDLTAAGIDPRKRAAIEGLVRAYLLDHPEVLPEAMERLRGLEARATIAPLRDALETPFDGAVLGNPKGRKVLVEFADYACGYCRRSEADVEALIAADPELKVVVRLLPIIGPQSEPAARMGLAAARQGRYSAFHKAIYAGPAPSEQSIAAAANVAKLDAKAAKAQSEEARVTDELQQNLALARRLGINGTPSWVVGDQLLSGAIGREKLEAAVAQSVKS